MLSWEAISTTWSTRPGVLMAWRTTQRARVSSPAGGAACAGATQPRAKATAPTRRPARSGLHTPLKNAGARRAGANRLVTKSDAALVAALPPLAPAGRRFRSHGDALLPELLPARGPSSALLLRDIGGSGSLTLRTLALRGGFTLAGLRRFPAGLGRGLRRLC